MEWAFFEEEGVFFLKDMERAAPCPCVVKIPDCESGWGLDDQTFEAACACGFECSGGSWVRVNEFRPMNEMGEFSSRVPKYSA